MRALLGRSRGMQILNVALLVLVLGAATAAFAAAGRDESSEPPATIQVERGVVVSTVSADGNVEPPTDLALGFETGGEVTEVAVREGDPVRRGQLLARVDDRSARANVDSAVENLDSARERLRDTREGKDADELDVNNRQLQQSQVAVDEARSDLVNARSSGATNVRTLGLAVRRARVTGERAQLRASRARLSSERIELRRDRLRYRNLEALADRIRAELDALRDEQRARANRQTESGSDVSRLESELGEAQSQRSEAESSAASARQAETEVCGGTDASACSGARRERQRADDDARDADRDLDQAERDVDDARREDVERSQDLTNADAEVERLELRRATIEQDEQTAKGDLDSSEATVREYRSQADSDATSLREARRTLGSQRDELANGVEQAEQQIDQANGSLRSARASLRVTEATIEEDESGADEVDVAADRASVASAAASVQDARQALDETELRAPADAVAANVDVKVGEVVGASTPSLGGGTDSGSAATDAAQGAEGGTGGTGTSSGAGSTGAGSGAVISLSQLEGLQVEAGFSETDAARVSPGDTARIAVDALPDQEFAAHVVAIDPEETIVDNVVTYDVTFFLDSPQGLLKPGMTATSDVIVEESDGVLSVPRTAVRSPRGSSPTATVVHSDGRQEARLLVTGLEGDSSVEVVGGLGEGERVAVPGGRPPAG